MYLVKSPWEHEKNESRQIRMDSRKVETQLKQTSLAKGRSPLES